MTDEGMKARTMVRQVACPNCGAEPGRLCIGVRDKPRETNHKERVEAANQAAARAGDGPPRISVGREGYFAANDGSVFGRLSAAFDKDGGLLIAAEVDGWAGRVAISVGGLGGVAGSSSSETNTEPRDGGLEETRSVRDERVDRIWSAYATTMKPRRMALDPQARAVIRDALKVASEAECVGAIRGCAKSRFHMGDNDLGKKYNSVSQILRGKRGVRTTREQIDLMLRYDEENDSAELPSGTLAEIEEAKRTIRRYAAYIGELPQRFVAEARQKLMAHGIEVTIIQHEPPTPIEISFSDGVRT